ncbi:MAG: MFS transporter [Actinobacteria bacterium]|nr:MFS transporter [Actinomycetota bacterium]
MILSSLRHRNYRIYFIGSSISSIGTWVHRIAQDWLVLELTNSGQALGIVVSAQFLPGFFFSLSGGSLADRFDKRKALILCNFFGSLISLLLGLLVIAGKANVTAVTVAAFLLGTTNAIDGPIRQSYYVILVGEKDLPNALSLNSANLNVGRLIGPVLSGVLIERFGTGPSFIINSATFVVVLFSLLLIKPVLYEADQHSTKLDGGARLRAGVNHVLSKPELYMSILAVSFLAMWGQDMQITSAMMARETFARGAASFGALGSSLALGAIVGALVFARNTRLPNVRNVGWAALKMSGAWILASVAPNFPLYAAALFLSGYFAMGVNISGNGSLRTYSSSRFYGRAWGIYIFVWQTLIALGAPILGWINQNFSPRIAIGFGALMAALMAIYLLKRFQNNQLQECA